MPTFMNGEILSRGIFSFPWANLHFLVVDSLDLRLWLLRDVISEEKDQIFEGTFLLSDL